MTWGIVVNPAAGRRVDLRHHVEEALRSAGVDFRIEVSAAPHDVVRIVQDLTAAGIEKFAGVGGDGTAHLLVNALLRTTWANPPTLGILPAGSGSDFIRTFALPKDLTGAAAHLAGDETYPCDVGVLEGSFGTRYFLNAVNVGVAAASARFAERLPRRMGGLRYGIGFWLALAGFRVGEVQLTAGQRTYAGPAINLVIANGQFFGGGMNIAPRASVLDGEFDVQLFLGPRRAAFSVMPRVIRGLHLRHHAVRRFVASEVRFECPEDWPVEADGEMIGRGPVSVSILPSAIRFKI